MPTPTLQESCFRSTTLFESALFSIADCRCAGLDTPSRREEWCHEDRIVVTRRGVWELDIAGDARVADPVTATCWNGTAPYRVRHPLASGVRCHCTVFRLTAAGSEALRQMFWAGGGRPPRGTFTYRTRPIDGETYYLHRRALERARYAPGAADAPAIEEPALAFLRRMISERASGAEAGRASAASRRVGDARDLIAREFRKPLTVAGIARAVGCSPFHLSRLFRAVTGATLHRTIVRLRLREGLERLLDEPDRVSRIAVDVGFASHSHFTDAFRAEYGCPPREARRLRRRSALPPRGLAS